MKSTVALSVCVVLLATLVPSAAVGQGFGDPKQLERARMLFDVYIRLEHAFDPAVAELYSDEALIRNKRTYPTGQVRVLEMEASKYKALIAASMPLAKERGDVSTYSEVQFATEGPSVRITAQPYSELKRYSSPLSLLVGPDANGEWRILEELSESKPLRSVG